MTSRMLVAGVGNIFLGDDGFGVEVARRLATEDLPGWVRVADYGISGLHLAYDLADGYETTILVDATSRGDDPGTVYVIELDHSKLPGLAADSPGTGQLFDAHGMQPDVLFGVLGMLGAEAGRVLLVGCEPASVDYGIGLSPPVTAAVGEAVRVVKDLIAAAGGGQRTASGVQRRPAAISAQPVTVPDEPEEGADTCV
jgi:hydrogenase maturation protease